MGWHRSPGADLDALTAVVLLSFSILAGVIGATFGLGGGIIIVPTLTLALGFSMQEAVGASLVGIIASSTGSAARYLEQGLVNVKLAMTLETATTAGAIVGAVIAVYLNQTALALLFAGILVYSAYYMLTKMERRLESTVCEGSLDLSCSYRDSEGKEVAYGVTGLRKGLAASFFAGSLSNMLGVGGGTIQVPVMNTCMCVPMKAAAATSNLMIGVTALTGAIIFYANGLIVPYLAATVAVGVFFGAMVGTRMSKRSTGTGLRKAFAVVVLFIAFLMILKAVGIWGAGA
jgi:uncharacterized membrane protein YfcA